MNEELEQIEQMPEEDFILPDEDAEPQAEEEQQTEEETEETTEEETQQEMTEEDEQQTEGMTESEKNAFLKIKYNKEEIALDEEKAKELAQKGMNYDKVQEKLQELENDPRFRFVESQAEKHNMTVEQYLEAVQEQEEQARLNELIEQNIPEDVAREMLENRKFREQYENDKKTREKEETSKKDYETFLQTYPDVNPEEIPKSVWEEVEQGKSLVDAYIRHENQLLKDQIANLKKSKDIETKNEENKKKAVVGSVTGHGSTETAEEDDFLKGFNSI